MSGYLGPGGNTIVQTKALWTWSTPVSGKPQTVISYPTVPGALTKSGLGRSDLERYIGMPIQGFGSSPAVFSDQDVISWIRWAEDDIESETNVRLCQTWVAAPPAKSQTETQLLNLGVKYSYQQLGIDYDLAEPAYDFFFERARDEGWLYQRLRWRPVKAVEIADPSGITSSNYRGIQNLAFIYPLLNEFFRMPQSWMVEDQNRGLVRMVPATSVQMLPLFAMQLAFMGFAQSVPGGLWFQYTAGLTSADYQSEWSFMLQLVLARAAMRAYTAMMTGVNLGMIEQQVNVDGLMRKVRYSEKGPFVAQITRGQEEVDRLTKRAKMKAGGIHFGII